MAALVSIMLLYCVRYTSSCLKLRLGALKCLIRGINNHFGIKCTIDFPTYDATTVPVDYSSPVQKNCLIKIYVISNGPSLIWRVYDCIEKKIGTYRRLLHPLGNVHFGIDCMNVHFIHIAANFATTNKISMLLELHRHLSRTPG